MKVDKKSFNYKIGQRLKYYREQSGITQYQMAEYANLSKNYISAIERGVNTTNIQTIVAYSNKLGISVDELLDTGFSDSINPELKHFLKNKSDSEQQYILNVLKTIFKD